MPIYDLRSIKSILCRTLIFLFFLTCLPAFSETNDSSIWALPTYQRKMLEVGDRIVSGNQILIPIQFTISDQSKQIIAFYKKGDSRILIGRDLFETIRSDDELAAVLGHEIAHILQGESGAFGGGNIMNILVTAIYAPDAVQTSASLGASTKNFFKRSFTLNRESAADIRGLELMVKAGYNPTAMETILSKIMQDDGNLNRKGRKTYTERLELIHKAIEQNYPQSLLQ